jgi:dihydrolipoamide dehydrogenase
MSTSRERTDAVVIGSGPGGYVAGIRLGQLGVKTVVVEKERAGGVCLNVGCIPSKALIHAAKTYAKLGHVEELGIRLAAPPTVDMAAMQAWKERIVGKLTGGVKMLLKANQTELVQGAARVAAAGSEGWAVTIASSAAGGAGETRTLVSKNVIVATGSRPIEIPGFAVDQKRVLDSTGGLALTEVPRRLVVIGGGYIGLELGTVYAKLGSKVTVVEALDTVLAGIEPECVQVVARKLRKMGIEVLLEARAQRCDERGDRAVVTVATKDGGTVALDADKILLTVGRRPNSEDLGLAEAGVAIDRKGFVVVDSHMRTNQAGIYAIGDVVGGMMLAHKASKEAEVVAEIVAGHASEMDARTIPAVVFTDPEIASTGMTEAEAQAAGHTLKVGKFPFAGLGRALSVNEPDGFAKVVADAQTGAILGVHVVGNGASDLISEGALAIEMGAVLHDVALTVHPHPTLGESIMEAAKAALGEAVHMVNR